MLLDKANPAQVGVFYLGGEMFSYTDENANLENKMYNEFLRQKLDYGANSGFKPLLMPDFLFDFQAHLTDWAIKKGRSALFADCGLGKTPMQLVWAQNTLQKTNKPVLILTPLAVSTQTIEEAEKFGIEAKLAVKGKTPKTIQVTNYEQLHHYNPNDYGSVVCDESSILKNFDGTRKTQITEFMRTIPYRLLCTATAAPNDWPELGTSSEALGYLGWRDMLSTFFKRQQVHALNDRGGRKEWQLRGWAEKGPFWRWVCGWARACRKPSDLGFDDDGFVLPQLIERETLVRANSNTPGMLVDMPAVGFHQEKEAIRRTIQERCEMAAQKVNDHNGISMVWCHRNEEGILLNKLIPNSVEIAGKHSDDRKVEAADWFRNGYEEKRVLISKPKIFGFGMNFQHSNHFTYFPDHSYEKYYQASRRQWRYGQENDVIGDLIYTDGGKRMMDNLRRKTEIAAGLFKCLIDHMNNELNIQKDVYQKTERTLPQWI